MSEQFSKPLGDPIEHLWLVQSMAKATGVDLSAAMQSGQINQDTWAGMVHKCRGCDWQRDGGGCGKWLALQVPGEAEVPSSCANQDVFADLSDG